MRKLGQDMGQTAQQERIKGNKAEVGMWRKQGWSAHGGGGRGRRAGRKRMRSMIEAPPLLPSMVFCDWQVGISTTDTSNYKHFCCYVECMLKSKKEKNLCQMQKQVFQKEIIRNWSWNFFHTQFTLYHGISNFFSNITFHLNSQV